jgi:hypothetical protein
VEFLNFRVEVIQRLAERSGQRVVLREEGSPIWSKDPEIDLAVEEGGPKAIGGRGIAVRPGDSVNEALEPKPTEVVRHLSRGIWAAEKGFDLRAEVTIAECAATIKSAASDN